MAAHRLALHQPAVQVIDVQHQCLRPFQPLRAGRCVQYHRWGWRRYYVGPRRTAARHAGDLTVLGNEIVTATRSGEAAADVHAGEERPARSRHRPGYHAFTPAIGQLTSLHHSQAVAIRIESSHDKVAGGRRRDRESPKVMGAETSMPGRWNYPQQGWKGWPSDDLVRLEICKHVGVPALSSLARTGCETPLAATSVSHGKNRFWR